MGGILLRAFLGQELLSPSHASATMRHADRAEKLAKELGIRVGTDNRAAVRDADVVLLAVKPVTVAEVLREIGPEIKPGTLVVSVAASATTKSIEQHLAPNVSVVRAMPNTPCAIGCGMTSLSGGVHWNRWPKVA
jgi:pyrroline-5-carboxylate reductase